MDIKWTHLTETLNRFADTFIELARANLTNNNSNASYALYDSMEKIVEVGEDYYSVKISLEDYWVFTENGRGPGKFPPPDAIRRWIEVKPVEPSPINGRTPTVDQLTFLISRKIANEGTPPQPFFQPAVDEALRTFSGAIDKAIEDDVADFIQEAVERMFGETFK